MNKRKFKAQPKVKAAGTKIPKRYTTGEKAQATRMAKEIKKFRKDKSGKGYFQWSGDTDMRTGKRFKTKPSKATIAFHKKYKQK